MYQKPSPKAVQEPQGSGLILGHIAGEMGGKPVCSSQFYFGKVVDPIVSFHERLYQGNPSGTFKTMTIDDYFVLAHYTPAIEKFRERVAKKETGPSLLENLTHTPVILTSIERDRLNPYSPKLHKFWSRPAIVKGADREGVQLYTFPLVDGALCDYETLPLEIVGVEPMINPLTMDKLTMATLGLQARDMLKDKEREIKAKVAKDTKAFDEFSGGYKIN